MGTVDKLKTYKQLLIEILFNQRQHVYILPTLQSSPYQLRSYDLAYRYVYIVQYLFDYLYFLSP